MTGPKPMTAEMVMEMVRKTKDSNDWVDFPGPIIVTREGTDLGTGVLFAPPSVLIQTLPQIIGMSHPTEAAVILDAYQWIAPEEERPTNCSVHDLWVEGEREKITEAIFIYWSDRRGEVTHVIMRYDAILRMWSEPEFVAPPVDPEIDVTKVLGAAMRGQDAINN